MLLCRDGDLGVLKLLHLHIWKHHQDLFQVREGGRGGSLCLRVLSLIGHQIISLQNKRLVTMALALSPPCNVTCKQPGDKYILVRDK